MNLEQGSQLDRLRHLPHDDGIEKADFKVKNLYTTSTDSRCILVDYADLSNEQVTSSACIRSSHMQDTAVLCS